MKSKVKQNYSEQLRMLVKRHLLVFFNNRMRVFFTLMVPFIVFVIYIFFLRNLELLTVKDVFRESTIDVLKNFDPAGNAEINRHVGTILDSWMLSGIMAFSTLTVSLQTNNIIVADKENGINRDFASSPVSNTILILSYFIFNFIVTLIVSFIFIIVCFIYLAALGEFVLTFLDVITILGVLLFSTINSVLFTILICSFVSKDMTMVSIMTVFSSAIGFLIGAYMPFYMMPAAVQNVCCFIPGTYCCSLFRYSFLSTPIARASEYIVGVDPVAGQQILDGLTGNFGYNLEFFNLSVTPQVQAAIIAGFTVLLVALNLLTGKHLTSVIGSMGKKLTKTLRQGDGRGKKSE